MLFSLERKLCRTLWSVDMVHVGVCAYLLGKGPAALVLRHTCPRKAVLATHRGCRTWCNQVRQPVLVLCCLLKLVYDEDRGGKCHQQLLCPQRGESILAVLREAPSEEQIISHRAS